MSRWAFGLYGLAAGAILASLMLVGAGAIGQPAPAPTVTVTAPAQTNEPSVEPSEPEPSTYTPRKADWQVGVKVTSKQCFGEAGCNVEVTIDPQFVGTEDPPDTGTIEVTYELVGTEDPLVDSFTVEDGQVHYTKTQNVQTRTAGAKIKAKVTDVTYTE